MLLRVFPSVGRHEHTQRGAAAPGARRFGSRFCEIRTAAVDTRDLLPLDIADELALLQDQVAPFPANEAIERIEHALGKPIAECFAEFDANPLAAASVAQVHGARLPDGSRCGGEGLAARY